MIHLKPIQIHQNYFPHPKGSDFDEIFKSFFYPLGFGEKKNVLKIYFE
jgi:hypothetical protein